ncbi:hypothetical protein MIMGU_mgv1a006196mg [Erythranthe guttata]|uniref:Glycosyltransferase n=1 Tax=Erythranthe guttata TaxID=4155 RepID=A0A022RI55_ERYGU|nr:hypothetical protein MIMGU_mgv1a006196mg [Erythranthe guttata]
MAIKGKQPHFILFPLMAQGHMIPIMDIATMLSERGVASTILTTPHNAARFHRRSTQSSSLSNNIHILNIEFPCVEAGLPRGCENLDMLPSSDDVMKFFKAAAMMKDHIEHLLRRLKPSPTCLISDMWFPWTTDLALKLRIPRLVFYGTSCFSLLCMHILGISDDFHAMASDSDYFVVPGLPDRIEVTKAHFKATFDQLTPEWTRMWDELREAEANAFGTVSNSFDELETHYIEGYRKAKGNNVWCIGPVSLCNKEDSDKALMELGLGLEASKKPFIWVIRNASDELQTWLLEEKFRERNNGRGLLIHGWSPQVLILSHRSIGGFLTHCGWNSTLEGITAGVPMMTWPLSAEQFFNERLIVNVIKVGVRVGVEVPAMFLERENDVVKSEEIRRGVEVLMDEGEEGRERRERAREMGEMAKRAVEEGGSSHRNMAALIQDVVVQQSMLADDQENA